MSNAVVALLWSLSLVEFIQERQEPRLVGLGIDVPARYVPCFFNLDETDQIWDLVA